MTQEYKKARSNEYAALDPVSHKAFVAYASLFANPRISVFSPTMVNDAQKTTAAGLGSEKHAPGALNSVVYSK